MSRLLAFVVASAFCLVAVGGTAVWGEMCSTASGLETPVMRLLGITHGDAGRSDLYLIQTSPDAPVELTNLGSVGYYLINLVQVVSSPTVYIGQTSSWYGLSTEEKKFIRITVDQAATQILSIEDLGRLQTSRIFAAMTSETNDTIIGIDEYNSDEVYRLNLTTMEETYIMTSDMGTWAHSLNYFGDTLVLNTPSSISKIDVATATEEANIASVDTCGLINNGMVRGNAIYPTSSGGRAACMGASNMYYLAGINHGYPDDPKLVIALVDPASGHFRIVRTTGVLDALIFYVASAPHIEDCDFADRDACFASTAHCWWNGTYCQEAALKAGRAQSEGSEYLPHCSVSRTCTWDNETQDECAHRLCEAAGFATGTFVSASNDMCSSSFTEDEVWSWSADMGGFDRGNDTNNTQIVADCVCQATSTTLTTTTSTTSTETTSTETTSTETTTTTTETTTTETTSTATNTTTTTSTTTSTTSSTSTMSTTTASSTTTSTTTTSSTTSTTSSTISTTSSRTSTSSKTTATSTATSSTATTTSTTSSRTSTSSKTTSTSTATSSTATTTTATSSTATTSATTTDTTTSTTTIEYITYFGDLMMDLGDDAEALANEINTNATFAQAIEESIADVVPGVDADMVTITGAVVMPAGSGRRLEMGLRQAHRGLQEMQVVSVSYEIDVPVDEESGEPEIMLDINDDNLMVVVTDMMATFGFSVVNTRVTNPLIDPLIATTTSTVLTTEGEDEDETQFPVNLVLGFGAVLTVIGGILVFRSFKAANQDGEAAAAPADGGAGAGSAPAVASKGPAEGVDAKAVEDVDVCIAENAPQEDEALADTGLNFFQDQPVHEQAI